MKRSVITVTEAARTFADCINRVHYQGMSFLLLKNGKPVARLEPNEEKTCSAHQLAEVIKQSELSAEEARDWHADLAQARKKLKAPADKWNQ